VAAVAGLRAALPVLLDFLLAAGLLRLSVALSWEEVLTVAAVVAVRHLVVAGLGSGGPPAARSPRGAPAEGRWLRRSSRR
uniref:DUF1622 domain-containing protein n=1 Tax=Ornithinicoccus halotolerans TaxID=1748220 RepID=UPI001297A08A